MPTPTASLSLVIRSEDGRQDKPWFDYNSNAAGLADALLVAEAGNAAALFASCAQPWLHRCLTQGLSGALLVGGTPLSSHATVMGCDSSQQLALGSPTMGLLARSAQYMFQHLGQGCHVTMCCMEEVEVSEKRQLLDLIAATNRKRVATVQPDAAQHSSQQSGEGTRQGLPTMVVVESAAEAMAVLQNAVQRRARWARKRQRSYTASSPVASSHQGGLATSADLASQQACPSPRDIAPPNTASPQQQEQQQQEQQQEQQQRQQQQLEQQQQQQQQQRPEQQQEHKQQQQQEQQQEQQLQQQAAPALEPEVHAASMRAPAAPSSKANSASLGPHSMGHVIFQFTWTHVTTPRGHHTSWNSNFATDSQANTPRSQVRNSLQQLPSSSQRAVTLSFVLLMPGDFTPGLAWTTPTQSGSCQGSEPAQSQPQAQPQVQPQAGVFTEQMLTQGQESADAQAQVQTQPQTHVPEQVPTPAQGQQQAQVQEQERTQAQAQPHTTQVLLPPALLQSLMEVAQQPHYSLIASDIAHRRSCEVHSYSPGTAEHKTPASQAVIQACDNDHPVISDQLSIGSPPDTPAPTAPLPIPRPQTHLTTLLHDGFSNALLLACVKDISNELESGGVVQGLRMLAAGRQLLPMPPYSPRNMCASDSEARSSRHSSSSCMSRATTQPEQLTPGQQQHGQQVTPRQQQQPQQVRQQPRQQHAQQQHNPIHRRIMPATPFEPAAGVPSTSNLLPLPPVAIVGAGSTTAWLFDAVTGRLAVASDAKRSRSCLPAMHRPGHTDMDADTIGSNGKTAGIKYSECRMAVGQQVIEEAFEGAGMDSVMSRPRQQQGRAPSTSSSGASEQSRGARRESLPLRQKEVLMGPARRQLQQLYDQLLTEFETFISTERPDRKARRSLELGLQAPAGSNSTATDATSSMLQGVSVTPHNVSPAPVSSHFNAVGGESRSRLQPIKELPPASARLQGGMHSMNGRTQQQPTPTMGPQWVTPRSRGAQPTSPAPKPKPKQGLCPADAQSMGYPTGRSMSARTAGSVWQGTSSSLPARRSPGPRRPSTSPQPATLPATFPYRLSSNSKAAGSGNEVGSGIANANSKSPHPAGQQQAPHAQHDRLTKLPSFVTAPPAGTRSISAPPKPLAVEGSISQGGACKSSTMQPGSADRAPKAGQLGPRGHATGTKPIFTSPRPLHPARTTTRCVERTPARCTAGNSNSRSLQQTPLSARNSQGGGLSAGGSAAVMSGAPAQSASSIAAAAARTALNGLPARPVVSYPLPWLTRNRSSKTSGPASPLPAKPQTCTVNVAATPQTCTDMYSDQMASGQLSCTDVLTVQRGDSKEGALQSNMQHCCSPHTPTLSVSLHSLSQLAASARGGKPGEEGVHSVRQERTCANADPVTPSPPCTAERRVWQGTVQAPSRLPDGNKGHDGSGVGGQHGRQPKTTMPGWTRLVYQPSNALKDAGNTPTASLRTPRPAANGRVLCNPAAEAAAAAKEAAARRAAATSAAAAASRLAARRRAASSGGSTAVCDQGPQSPQPRISSGGQFSVGPAPVFSTACNSDRYSRHSTGGTSSVSVTPHNKPPFHVAASPVGSSSVRGSAWKSDAGVNPPSCSLQDSDAAPGMPSNSLKASAWQIISDKSGMPSDSVHGSAWQSTSGQGCRADVASTASNMVASTQSDVDSRGLDNRPSYHSAGVVSDRLSCNGQGGADALTWANTIKAQVLRKETTEFNPFDLSPALREPDVGFPHGPPQHGVGQITLGGCGPKDPTLDQGHGLQEDGVQGELQPPERCPSPDITIAEHTF